MQNRYFRGFLSGLIVVVGCMGAVLQAGCAGEKAADAGPIEIVLWEMMDPQERELLLQNITAFEAEHPDVKITAAHFGVEDVRNQFLTAALGGGGPDIIYGPSDQVGPLSAAGTLRPVEELFGAAFFERFHELTRIELNGHLWSVPEQFGNHLVLVYNRALINTPPADTDEMIRMAKASMVDADGDGKIDRYGLVFESKEPFWLAPWIGAFGGWVMNDENEPTLDTPAMASALEFCRELKATHGVIPQDCDYELADTLFREGRAAMIVNGPWSWKGYRDAGIEIGISSIPRMTSTNAWPTPMVSYRGYSISASCDDDKLEVVRAVVEFLTGADVQRQYAEKIGALPSLLELQGSDLIARDPVLAGSMEQVLRGQRMPIVPEMRAVWDAMRPALQNVMNGESAPAAAAKEMQKMATKKIAEMRS
ncbi:MAG: maltose ABC transporter substrate-binding protein [Gemmatimonadota bacterium]|nr:MAG: maltose ABC transporter substrate-binding protein [Gemmatimonadota bacterium]